MMMSSFEREFQSHSPRMICPACHRRPDSVWYRGAAVYKAQHQLCIERHEGRKSWRLTRHGWAEAGRKGWEDRTSQRWLLESEDAERYKAHC